MTSRRVAVLLFPLVLVACGGSDDGDSAAETPAAEIAEESSGDTLEVGADTTEAAGETASEPADSVADDSEEAPATTDAICDTIPPIELISEIVGEPVSTVTDLSDPTIPGSGVVSEKCEVTGEGVSLAIFERIDTETADLIVEASGQDPVTFAGDPVLDGARGVVNGVMIDRDGVSWMTTVVRMQWVATVDDPMAYETSAQLLRAWLAAAG